MHAYQHNNGHGHGAVGACPGRGWQGGGGHRLGKKETHAKLQTIKKKNLSILTYNSSPCLAFLSKTRQTVPKLPLPSFCRSAYLLAIKAFGSVAAAAGPLPRLAASWNLRIAPQARELGSSFREAQRASLLGGGPIHPSGARQCLKDGKSGDQAQRMLNSSQHKAHVLGRDTCTLISGREGTSLGDFNDLKEKCYKVGALEIPIGDGLSQEVSLPSHVRIWQN